LKEKKIQLTGIAAGQSPSLKLAKVLGRLRVATQEELDWPYLREWNEKARTFGFPNLAKARDVHCDQGFPGLVKARETTRNNDYAALARGGETKQKKNFPGLAKGRNTK
jgi:hypothetical protein